MKSMKEMKQTTQVSWSGILVFILVLTSNFRSVDGSYFSSSLNGEHLVTGGMQVYIITAFNFIS